jgi:hypothetical protein
MLKSGVAQFFVLLLVIAAFALALWNVLIYLKP